jgi:hypothetical protein
LHATNVNVLQRGDVTEQEPFVCAKPSARSLKSNASCQQKEMSAKDAKSIVEKLEQLSPEEASTFQLHCAESKQDTPDLIPSKVGSTLHLNFLRQDLSKDPLLQGLFFVALRR